MCKQLKNKDNDDDDSCEVMIKGGQCAEWDPFGDNEAPNEFMFLGFIAFACIGPGCNDPSHFSPLLHANVRDNLTKEQRKEMLHDATRKLTAKTAKIERQDQKASAVNMQMHCDIAMIALAKAKANDCADDRQLLALTSQLDAKRLEVDVVSKLLVGCDDDDDKLIELHELLKTLRTKIPLLENAETMMGIKGNDDAGNTNENEGATTT
jgi:hypothetical protein